MIKKIINRRDKGGIGIAIVSLFMLMLLELYIMVPALYQIRVTQAQSIQDDLHLSNLACYKDIDMSALAKAPVKEDDHEDIYVDDIKIKDPDTALSTFEEYLKFNMNLDNNFNPKNSGIIMSPIVVQEFTIYNVDKGSNTVSVESYNSNTHMFTTTVKQYKDGNNYLIRTSNDKPVENTCVSSTISFKTKTIFGNTIQSHASVDTDITK